MEVSLNFVKNLFGEAKPEIQKRLQRVIDNPCQKTWDDAYCIILNPKGGMKTLWQAVIAIDPKMPPRKPYNASWSYIPDSETIKRAIQNSVFEVNSN